MKVFWAIILLLVLATAALFVGTAYRQHAQAEAQAAKARADAEAARARAENEALKIAEAIESAKLGVHPPDGAPNVVPKAAADATPAATPGAVTDAQMREAFVSPISSPEATVKPLIHAPKPATIDPAPATTAAAPAAAAKPKPAAPLVAPTLSPAKIGEYDVMGAALIERTEDGALVFGDITIKGEGTEASPYVVPWDALIRAEEQFDPSRNSLRIPEFVAILHDKWVRLDGYVSFPLMTNQPKELLAMLNMWDGCCIGVPPTPYDAVEVHLKKAITGDERFSVSGRVTGRFSVKPYVVKSWLVGMYVMEDADFAPSEDDEGT
ncbi:MAG TPA: hypothetical protein VHN77_09080 [Phycisphaerales bacterium]|nr:hypothetical protein [Phycisphaerales bacterium]